VPPPVHLFSVTVLRNFEPRPRELPSIAR
jgi:hypothetical protein